MIIKVLKRFYYLLYLISIFFLFLFLFYNNKCKILKFAHNNFYALSEVMFVVF